MSQPMPELQAGDIMGPNCSCVDTRSFPPRMPDLLAVPPGIIPNLDLGMPVMPEERMAPPVMNQMQGEPRMMMAGVEMQIWLIFLIQTHNNKYLV